MKFKGNDEKLLPARIIAVALVLCLSLSVAANAALGDTVLKEGSSGQEVKSLQKKLSQLGYSVGAIDGKFGSATEQALKRFQKNRGIKTDGIFGDETAKELNRVSGESKNAGGKAVGYKSSDLNLLARAVYSEARGEPYIGQVAVAAVIMNRMQSSLFPKSIPDIIYQPGAFSAVADGQINLPADEQATKACKEAINGYDPTHGALYYFNPDKTSNKFIWSRPQIMKLGDHIFTR
ncbi:spore cortex-lytic enzyme [Syntrophobotulus glycolicus DSM 8271]|uniref:Spore cortex-lytic enzyme n=1 Tax=Syntrophobotulus glycolicus (strain DSM 8271 / FlGlyR) TaxID=645991 RepID=F0T2D7_SYNGF|nr:spore cortex-lytic enzyme [Syntrophobotulus glycolicus]ADY57565.1 spore cortex-lytic enzyme [Syntrophobotulus glycolicus DSM 8271]